MKNIAVIGSGFSGLLAAFKLSEKFRGADITVFESAKNAGGIIGRVDVCGLALDRVTESFAVRGGYVENLLKTLGLHSDLVEPNKKGACVAYLDKNGYIATRQLPALGLLGIPGDLKDLALKDILTPCGYKRALEDLERPMDLNDIDNIEDLVINRMGEEVLERLVRPVIGGIYSASPKELLISSYAGLSDALKNSNSLSEAIRRLKSLAPPGSSAKGIKGGIYRLVNELYKRCLQNGVKFRFNTKIESVLPENALWPLNQNSSAENKELSQDINGYKLIANDNNSYFCKTLFIACDAAGATRLLNSLEYMDPKYLDSQNMFIWPKAKDVYLATAIVKKNRFLSLEPLGTGILISKNIKNISAKALTHSSAKWQWVKDLCAPDKVEVIRLSYSEKPDTDIVIGDLKLLLKSAYAALKEKLDRGDILSFLEKEREILEGGKKHDLGDVLENYKHEINNLEICDILIVKTYSDAPYQPSDIDKRLLSYNNLYCLGPWRSGTGLASIVPYVNNLVANIL